MAPAPYFSIVIPVFNEEGNLRELHRRLTDVLTELGKPYEILFVDDGSSDDSGRLLRQLHAEDASVRALRFSRNFGHHIAITAGMDEARGEAIVLMDADLQDRPEAIPDLYAKLEEGYDVVYGVREDKQHSLFKRVTSAMFTSLMNRIISEGHSINTHIYRICRRPVIDAVKECREQYRFVVGLISWVGFSQTSIAVKHGARFAGQTKYSLVKMIRLALNTITAFSRVPLQLATLVGTLTSIGSFAFGFYLIIKKVLWDTAVEGWTSLMVVVLLLGGLQMLFLGVLGEYIGRIYGEIQGRPLYVISERIEGARKKKKRRPPREAAVGRMVRAEERAS